MTAKEKKEFLVQYHQIHDSLMRFCIVKSRGIMDPKDLANDVLLVGLENYHKLENKKALLSYLFTTANRICLNKIRRKKFTGNYDENYVENIKDPTNNVDTRVDISLLYRALNQLPPLQKEAVILFEISDLPIKEIMLIQNSKSSAVKQRIKRGREKLSELMREKEDSHKKIAIVASVLITNNAFSMSNLDVYFNAVKELPLPLSHVEVTNTINQFQLVGGANNVAAAKIGSAIFKKVVFGTLIISTIVGTSILLSNQNNKDIDNSFLTSEINSVSNIKSKQNVLKESKIVPYETILIQGEEVAFFDSKNNTPLVIDSLKSQPDSLIQKNKSTLINNTISTTIDSVTSTQHSTFEGDSYPIESVDLVTINLGNNVVIQTWDKPEIKIITNHIVEAKIPEEEVLILENLKYKVQKKGGNLFIGESGCSDDFPKIKNKPENIAYSSIRFSNGDKFKYKKLELHYVILLPATINLKIRGNYTNLIIPDMDGDMDLNISHSKLKTGNIQGHSNIVLNYSTVSMDNFNELELTTFQSNITIGNVSQLDLTANYSTFKATEIDLLKLKSIESVLDFGSIKNKISGSLKYTTLTCEKGNISRASLSAFQSVLSFDKIDSLKCKLNYSTLKAKEIKNFSLPTSFQSIVKILQVEKFKVGSSKYSVYTIAELSKKIKAVTFNDTWEIKKVKPSLSSMEFSGKYSNYTIKLENSFNCRLDYRGRFSTIKYDFEMTILKYEFNEDLQLIEGYLTGGDENSALLKFDCFSGELNFN